MTFNDDASLDSSQVSSGGGIPGGGLAIGGGGLGIVGLVLYLIFGGGLGGITGGGDSGQGNQITSQEIASECKTGQDANTKTQCRVVGYVNSVQAYWTTAFQQSGQQYQKANTVLFSSAVQTGCGSATSEVGPFYCPADSKVYLDISFFQELEKLSGTSGTFAQGYVVAHEYGHHVQNLLGTSDKASRGDQQGAESASVRLELQADCYAGVWAHHATQTTDASGKKVFEGISNQDINDALTTASAIGDDRLQQQGGGESDPETWTHGSAEQRNKWFRTGYDSGDPAKCDTFSGRI